MKVQAYDRLTKSQLIGFLKEDMKRDDKYYKMKRDDILDIILSNPNYRKSFFENHITHYDKYKKINSINFHKSLGIKQLTKDEIQNFKYDAEDYNDPYIGKKNKEGIIIELKEHQRKFLTGFLIGNLRCSIVFHGVGTGKTFTAVATSRMYLQLYPNNNIVFVSPPSVFFNFINSMVAYGIDPRDPRYKYFTYDKFYNQKPNTANSLLIVDEAHNFRTFISISENVNKHGEHSQSINTNKKGYALLQGGKLAHKVILLTGTPFINKTYDIENLLAIGEGRDPNNESTFGDIASDPKMRYDYFKYRISHFERNLNDSNYPERIEKFIPLITDSNEIRASMSKSNLFIFNQGNFRQHLII